MYYIMNLNEALKIFDLKYNYSKEELKKKYQKLALIYHPDKTNGNKEKEEKFKKISEAYQFLLNYNEENKYIKNLEQLFKNFEFNNNMSTTNINIYPLPNQETFIKITKEIINGQLIETKIERKNGVTRQTKRIIKIY